MHVLGVYNVVIALGFAGACSICAPVATHDAEGSSGRFVHVISGAGGYWADIHGGAAAPNRRVYFPPAPERDPKRPRLR